MNKSIFKIQNLHLVLSVAIVIPVALVYGLFPNVILPKLLDFKVETTDLNNVFRAIMGLYLAMASFWILGIIKSKFWYAETVSNVSCLPEEWDLISLNFQIITNFCKYKTNIQ